MRPTAPQILSWLRQRVPPDVRRWLEVRETLVEAEIEEAIAQTDEGTVTAPASLHDAADFVVRSAQQLLDGTVIRGGKMVKDEWGASVATLGSLRNVAPMDPSTLATNPALLADALEILRVHSRTQLDRKQWERAYRATKKALHQAELTDEEAADIPQPSITSAERSPPSGLTDGTHYAFQSDRLRIRFPFSKASGGTWGYQYLEQAGIPSWAWKRHKGANEKYAKYVDILDGSVLLDVADAVENRHPKLAHAIRQHASVWSKHIGQVPAHKRREGGADLTKSDRGQPLVVVDPPVRGMKQVVAPLRIGRTEGGQWGVVVRTEEEARQLAEILSGLGPRYAPASKAVSAMASDVQAQRQDGKAAVRARPIQTPDRRDGVTFTGFVPVTSIAREAGVRFVGPRDVGVWGLLIESPEEARRAADALAREGFTAAASDVLTHFGHRMDPI